MTGDTIIALYKRVSIIQMASQQITKTHPTNNITPKKCSSMFLCLRRSPPPLILCLNFHAHVFIFLCIAYNKNIHRKILSYKGTDSASVNW